VACGIAVLPLAGLAPACGSDIAPPGGPGDGGAAGDALASDAGGDSEVCSGAKVSCDGACVTRCPDGTTQHTGSCVNMQTDANDCGGCSKTSTSPANGEPICNAGICDFSCSAGFTQCGGKCADTKSDRSKCGGCGKSCLAPTRCKKAACSL